MDVFANKWVGSLRYREAEIFDGVLTSIYFEMKLLFHSLLLFRMFSGVVHVVVEPSRSSSIDPMSVDVGFKSSGNKLEKVEFVEDSNEGVLPLVNKRKAAWQCVSEQNVDGLALVRQPCRGLPRMALSCLLVHHGWLRFSLTLGCYFECSFFYPFVIVFFDICFVVFNIFLECSFFYPIKV